MANVLIFGASVVYGFYDTRGGWVDRLKKHYQKIEPPSKDFHTKVYNLGISGNTTSDIISRFQAETNPRLLDKETTIIFAVGINDAITIANQNKVPKRRFENNLVLLIQKSLKHTNNIVFVGLNPVKESLVTPMLWSPTESLSNKQILQYNNIVKETCKKQDLYFIDLFDNFSNLKYEGLLEDGLHPNAKGHEYIYKTVVEYLEKNNVI